MLQGIGGLKPQDANARLMCVGQGDVGGGFGRTVSAQELTSKFMKAMDADGAPRVVQSLCYSKCFTCSGLSRAHLLQPAHPYLLPPPIPERRPRAGDGKISKAEFFRLGQALMDMSAVHKLLATVPFPGD